MSSPSYTSRANAALQTIMQAAANPVDRWRIDCLSTLAQYVARWEFLNSHPEALPFEWDGFCNDLTAKGHRFATLTVSCQNGVGINRDDDREKRLSLTMVFGHPYMITERHWANQLMWRITMEEWWVYHEPMFRPWRDRNVATAPPPTDNEAKGE